MSKNKTEPMPRWWWLDPWTFAIGQWEARDRFYKYNQELADNWAKTESKLYNLRQSLYIKNNEWQPIETAPKYPLNDEGDGPEILIWCNKTHRIHQTCWLEQCKSWCDIDDGDLPTHWQPLLKPPVK